MWWEGHVIHLGGPIRHLGHVLVIKLDHSSHVHGRISYLEGQIILVMWWTTLVTGGGGKLVTWGSILFTCWTTLVT